MNTHSNTWLVRALETCASACNYCIGACLAEEDLQIMSNCIRLDIDCAEVCTVTASLLARGSVHGKHLLRECAELCNLCAAECEKHKYMQHCADCAEACRACEMACKAA